MENETKAPQEQAPAGLGEGDNLDSAPLLKTARDERERMERATRELKKENDRREAILAREMLGGRSAGSSPEAKVVEETPKEYVKRVLGGGAR
jgi:hypothetical protein